MGPIWAWPRRRARQITEIFAGALVYLAVALCTVPAKALDLADLLVPDLAAADWISGFDAFTGIDATGSSVFGYGGITLAPNGLDANGLRLRLYAGGGHYSYTSTDAVRPGVAVTLERRVEVLQAQALVGWQQKVGALTAALFAGLAYEQQSVTPADVDHALAGEHVGAKVALETWLDISPQAWLSADASYATTIEAYSGSIKLGLRPASWLSLGPAAAAFGDREYDGIRLGAFARWHCGGCDLTVSGGFSSDYADETGAYGALSFYRRF